MKVTNIRFFCVAYLSGIDSDCSGDHIDTVEITESCFISLLTDDREQIQYERHTVRENGCAQVCLTLDLEEWPDVEWLELVQ